MQASGVTGIVFDLAAVTFLDNDALAVIAATVIRIGRVAVAGAAIPLARLLEDIRMTRIAPAFGTSKEAVTFLRSLPKGTVISGHCDDGL